MPLDWSSATCSSTWPSAGTSGWLLAGLRPPMKSRPGVVSFGRRMMLKKSAGARPMRPIFWPPTST